MRIEITQEDGLHGDLQKMVQPHVDMMLDAMLRIAKHKHTPQHSQAVVNIAMLALGAAVCHAIENARDKSTPDGWEPTPRDIMGACTSMMMTILANSFPDFVAQMESEDEEEDADAEGVGLAAMKAEGRA
jgi:hypothetical protein